MTRFRTSGSFSPRGAALDNVTLIISARRPPRGSQLKPQEVRMPENVDQRLVVSCWNLKLSVCDIQALGLGSHRVPRTNTLWVNKALLACPEVQSFRSKTVSRSRHVSTYNAFYMAYAVIYLRLPGCPMRDDRWTRGWVTCKPEVQDSSSSQDGTHTYIWYPPPIDLPFWLLLSAEVPASTCSCDARVRFQGFERVVGISTSPRARLKNYRR